MSEMTALPITSKQLTVNLTDCAMETPLAGTFGESTFQLQVTDALRGGIEWATHNAHQSRYASGASLVDEFGREAASFDFAE